MYFPVAGIHAEPWIPPLVAFVVSFFMSMGGVSGAFLLLPFQMSFLGYVNPSVSATNQFYNVVAIPSGVYRYIREGRMVWPLTWVVIVGTLPGVLIGALVRVTWLPDARDFKLFAACVLAYIALRMVRDLTKKKAGNGKATAEEKFRALVRAHREKAEAEGRNPDDLPAVCMNECCLSRISYSFYGETYSFRTVGIFSLSFVVGIVGGVYGIGGGAIIAPFFVSFFGLPVYTVAGAALMGTFVTSVAGVTFYMAIAPLYPHMSVAPDWMLGLLLGLGGMAGMYLGARCQKYVSARLIKWMLCCVLLLTAGKYVLEFFR